MYVLLSVTHRPFLLFESKNVLGIKCLSQINIKMLRVAGKGKTQLVGKLKGGKVKPASKLGTVEDFADINELITEGKGTKGEATTKAYLTVAHEMFSFFKVPLPKNLDVGQIPVLPKSFFTDGNMAKFSVAKRHQLWLPSISVEKDERCYDLAVEEAQCCIQGIRA